MVNTYEWRQALQGPMPTIYIYIAKKTAFSYFLNIYQLILLNNTPDGTSSFLYSR